MTPNICIDFRPNPPGVDPGQDHKRSMRGPSPKDFFLRVGGVIPIVPLLYKTGKISVGQSGFWVIRGHSY